MIETLGGVGFLLIVILSIEIGYRIGCHVEHGSNSIEVIGTVSGVLSRR